MCHTPKDTIYAKDLRTYKFSLRYRFRYFNGNFCRHFIFLTFNSPEHHLRVDLVSK